MEQGIGTKTNHELLQSLVIGNVGRRPNIAIEFDSVAQKVLKTNSLVAKTMSQTNTGGTPMVEIGVLACGPPQMVKSINSICNVPSTSSSWLERDQQVYFSFTEEDWEW